MTYDEALAFWYGRINYEVRTAKPGDLKLERMRALLRLLGDPHDRLRLVHVTGTKGKGSTCAMVAAVLRAAGYRVGLFTSPHLEHVEERVQVNGVPISHEELAARMAEIAAAVRQLEGDEPGSPGLTFFEIGTALGFLHFCYRRCDVAVIEVGLGGRFDSTNVCRPLVSVITNIGWDHTAQLGHTLEEIAFQKAGIIKRRVPVVSGVTQEGPRAVVRKIAAELDAPLWELGPDFRWEESGEGRTLRRSITTPRTHYEDVSTSQDIIGAHQATNAAVAAAAIERLREPGFCIPDEAFHRGLQEVRWPARIEMVSHSPLIILDTAHNVPSTEALIHTLENYFPHIWGRKVVVLAVSSDKDYRSMLRILAGYFDHFHLTKYGDNPRGVPAEKLVAVLDEVAPGKPFSLHATAAEAWAAARSAAEPADLVCVTGSVFLAGELRAAVTNSPRQAGGGNVPA
jgi:dihydrofolate synthase/folylpolyglutamate synthase